MTTHLDEAATALAETHDDDTANDGGQTTGGALFDSSQYEREDLQIDRIDGQTVDKIRVKFSGSVMLDRSDPADVALFNRLKLGQESELRVSGTVSASGGGFTTDKGGDLDAIVAEKTVKVDSVWVLVAEQS